jgi:KUP system potassium uptake protein
MFENSIVYEDNVIVSIFIRDVPSGVSSSFKARLADGLRVFEIRMGYMEVVDVIKLVREAGIRERTIFYGIEDIVTCNPVWQVFAVIKKLSPSFVQFYKLPQNEIHGVITRVEM